MWRNKVANIVFVSKNAPVTIDPHPKGTSTKKAESRPAPARQGVKIS